MDCVMHPSLAGWSIGDEQMCLSASTGPAGPPKPDPSASKFPQNLLTSHMRTSAPLFTTNSSCLVPKGFTAALYSVTSHPMRPITFTLPSVVLICERCA
eukprot:1159912-Pelagomonas_calceolata.AAC.5